MTLEIGGTVYEPISHDSYTVEYDLYMQRVLEAAGVADLLAAGQTDTDEQREALAGQLIDRLTESGQLPRLLSGFVGPEGQRWTPKWAKQTAEIFAALTDPKDRALLIQVFNQGLLGFFHSGLTS